MRSSGKTMQQKEYVVTERDLLVLRDLYKRERFSLPAPTRRQIAAVIGMSSEGSAQAVLEKLSIAGLVVIHEDRDRGLSLTEAGRNKAKAV